MASSQQQLILPQNGWNHHDMAPLYMSLIAGMSTCLGAVWVLCVRKPASSTSTSTASAATATATSPKMKLPGTPNSRSPSEPVIRPSTMCFSLALAGSVMITVSVVSILPECLRDTTAPVGDGYHMMSLFSMAFVIRAIFHGLGYLLYYILAKFAFPEPEEILGLHAKHADFSLDDENDVELQSLLLTTNSSNQASLDEEEELFRTSAATAAIVDDKQTTPAKPKNTTAARNRGKTTATATTTTTTSIANTLASNSNFKNGKQALTIDTIEANTAVGNDETDNHHQAKDNKSQHFFRSFSRYSSGADLDSPESKRAWRVAMLLFLSLSVHNFPEGLAVAASALNSKALGWKVTIGIMIHNIPEGVSIAVPCLAARPNNPCLAFWLSALSGLAEPFGAFVALFVLRNIDANDNTLPQIFNMENVLSFVAGIMIMVALAELFPEARRHTHEGKMPLISGTICGMVLMLATELYLA